MTVVFWLVTLLLLAVAITSTFMTPHDDLFLYWLNALCFLAASIFLTAVTIHSIKPPTHAWTPTIDFERWLRNRRYTYTNGTLLVCFGLFWVWLAYTAVTQRPETTGNEVGLLVMSVPLALVCFWLGVREARCGLRFETGHILLRGMLRTWDLPAAAVNGFTPTRAAHAPCPLLHRQDGRSIRVTGLSRMPLANSDPDLFVARLGPICENLNAQLSRARADIATVDSRALAEQATAERHTAGKGFRNFEIGYVLVFAATGGGVIAYAPSTFITIAVFVAVALNTAWVWTAFRAVKRRTR